jgi:3-hydroxyisobutyrate dehydrogenase-like beta-hydroxyacid dehydrogenase
MSIRARKNVGVIGLGIIGQRVADRLRERGFHVFVWNRTPRPVPNFVGSPAEVAELCDFIQIFVSDDEALLQTAQRITRELGPNHIVLAHCTVSPDTMRAAAEIVEKRGARFLDAPFTGSKMAAETGQLVYYVGGDEAALRQARPVLEASSKEIIEIGRVGDATTIKVATNMVTAASVQAAAEALALVSKSGLPVEKFADAMRNNGSNSSTLDMKLPMMMEGNFEAHFSVKHMLKDVVIATRLARAFGMEFGATDASRHGLVEEMRQGRGDDDYSSLFRQFFPAGRSLKSDQQVSNGEDDQPRFAGLDEGKATEPTAMGSNAPAPAEAKIEKEPTVVTLAPDEPDEGALRVAAAHSMTTVAESDAEPTVQPASPDKEERSGEPRGVWGGFWRRRTDD